MQTKRGKRLAMPEVIEVEKRRLMWNLKRAMKWVLGLLFLLAGVNHFLRPDLYVRIMPPYLPWHLALVYVSGVFEVALGALLLAPRYTVPAAWSLIVLLIAVFPANVHMALNAEHYPLFSPAVLWARLPLQGVLIAWAYWFTRTPREASDVPPGRQPGAAPFQESA